MNVYDSPAFRALANERVNLLTKGYAGTATDADRERLRVVTEAMRVMERATILNDIERLKQVGGR